MPVPYRTRATDADGPVTQDYLRSHYARKENGKAFRDLRAENLRRFAAFQKRTPPAS